MEVRALKTLSVSEAKMKLSSLVDAVSSVDEEVVITRNGRPAAVLVSPDEYDSWKETLAVRADPDLMKEIKKGVGALKKGRARLYTLDELFE
jgi:prevent-host-death family protein